MNKTINTSFRRRIFVALCLLMLCNASITQAQTVTIGSTTPATGSYFYGPIYRSSTTSSFNYSRYVYLYSNAELGIPSGSIITQIEWLKGSGAAPTGQISANNIFNIFLDNTSASTVPTGQTWGSFVTSATQVYASTTQAITSAASSFESFTLSGSFTYNGQGLYVLTDWEKQTTSPANLTNWVVNSATGMALGYASGTPAPTNATIIGTSSSYNNNRPTVRITYIPGSACTAPPVAGTPSISPTTATCPGEQVSLNTTGNSFGSGQTYQWESSTTSGGPYSPIGTASNTPALTVFPTVTTYYRLAVTCSGQTTYTSEVAAIVNTPLAGGTYTINSGAATGGSNYQSFTDAANAIRCGIAGAIVFNVSPGTYNEQVTLPSISGSSATNTITFNGNGATLSFNSVNSSERAGIKLNGADYVRINNLNIVGTGTGTVTTEYSWGIELINDADNNIISGCTITTTDASTSSNFAGIVISGSATGATSSGSFCDNNQILNNTINGGYYGITVIGSVTPDFSVGNIVKGNTVKGFYLYGIYTAYTDGVLVDSNNISRPNRTGVSTFYGVSMVNGNLNGVVSRNRIYNPFGGLTSSTATFYGVYLSSSDAVSGSENTIKNNLIYNVNGEGIQYGLYNSSSDYARFYHNTVVLDDQGATSTSTSYYTRGFYSTSLTTGIELFDNIFAISRNSVADKHAIYIGTTGTTFTSDYNDFYITSTTGTINNVGYLVGTQAPTLSDWQTVSGGDANSITLNPAFVNVVSGNYSPGLATFDNKGTGVGVVIDINGNPRDPSTPDIGAYEFTIGACTAPPVAGTAISDAMGKVCPGTTVNLNLTGNSSGTGQSYLWQSSSSSNGPWTAVSAADPTPSQVVNPTIPTYYRARANCSGQFSFSTAVFVDVNLGLSGTFTVDATQPASNSNFQSLSAAVNALQCGMIGPVTLNVVAGTGPYSDITVLNQFPGMSAANTLIINGNGNTIDFNTSISGNRSAFKLNGADYVTIDNFVINALGSYGTGVQMFNDADHNTITNLTINLPVSSTSSVYTGINIGGSETSATTSNSATCDSNIVSNNIINGGYYGITMVANGGSDFLAEGNIVTNNTLNDPYFYGIYVNGDRSGLIEGNDMSRNNRTTTSTFYGVYFTSKSSNSRVSKNKIHNIFTAVPTTTSTFYGIYHSSSDAPNDSFVGVSNNLIYAVSGSGSNYGIYNSGSDNVHYVHNTISFNDPASTASSSYVTRGIYQLTATTGVIFYNNNISVIRGGATVKTAAYFGTTGTDLISDHNNLYVDPLSSTSFVGYYSGTQLTLTDLQSASGLETNSVSADPMFNNPVSGDYSSNSNIVNYVGRKTPVTTDINGVVRSTNSPSAGAYEFQCPIASATNVSVSDITGTTLKLHFNRGNGTGVLVVASKGAPNTQAPVPSVTYAVSNAGDVTAVGNADLGNGKVIYNGSTNPAAGINVNVKNLQSGDPVYFTIYEYTATCVDRSPAKLDTTLQLVEPTKQAKLVNFTNVTPYSFTINWTNGNGSNRIVVLREGSAVVSGPIDNVTYAGANSVFGTGGQTGPDDYIVYSGSADSVNVTGLKAFTTYYAAVFEYNGPVGTMVDYKNFPPATKSQTTATDFVTFDKTGISYRENFDDSLVVTGTSSALPDGWHLVETGTSGNNTYTASTGSSSTGNTYSFGLSTAPDNLDRALGSVYSSTVMPRYGVRFRNNTGKTLTSVLVQYTGEQWRRGNTTLGAPDTLRVAYSFDATALDNGNWTRVPALDFLSPITTSSIATLNGNLPVNQTRISRSITGLSLAPDAYIWIRFVDADLTAGTGGEDGLAVDNVVVVPFENTILANTNSGTVNYNFDDLNVVGGTYTIDTTSTIKYATNIEAGAKIDINGNKFTAKGELFGTGTFSGSNTSTLAIGGTDFNQNVYMTPGANTLYVFQVKPNGSATLMNALDIVASPKPGSVKIGSTIAMKSASLRTNGFLTLKSDEFGTANIGKVEGSISGQVTVERYLYPTAGSRWISHPFSDPKTPLSLSDDITLDYTPGTGNLKYFNSAVAVTTNNIADFNNAVDDITSSSFSWGANQGIRLDKPSGDVILDYSGFVKTGIDTVLIAKGNSTDFKDIGNPYASSVKLANPINEAINNGYIAPVIYQWNPLLGSGGAFVTIPQSKLGTAKLVMGATVVLDMDVPNGQITFNESDKTATKVISKYMRAEGDAGNEEWLEEADDNDAEEIFPNGVTLSVEKAGKLFDELYVRFDGATTTKREKQDALKLANPALNFYAMSSDMMRLAVDTRPFETGKSIPLGMTSTQTGEFSIRVSEFHLTPGTELFLMDKTTGTGQMLEAEKVYNFTMNDMTNRFSLRMGKSNGANISSTMDVQLLPNPATDVVNIRVNTETGTSATVRVLSLTGASMMNATMENTNHGQLSLPVSNLAAGIYTIEVTTADGQRTTKQLMKQ